jgi:hypothetical protein
VGGDKVKELYGSQYYEAMGRTGGEACKANRHGSDYYKEIGAKGARNRWAKWRKERGISDE